MKNTLTLNYYYKFNATQWKGLCIHVFALIKSDDEQKQFKIDSLNNLLR